jgi:hypothetical protein
MGFVFPTAGCTWLSRLRHADGASAMPVFLVHQGCVHCGWAQTETLHMPFEQVAVGCSRCFRDSA